MPRLNPFAWGRTTLTKLWATSIDGHVVSLAWPPFCGTAHGYIAAASADGPITLFDPKSGEKCHILAGHGFGTASIGFSADGTRLASAGQDARIRLWEPFVGIQLRDMPAGATWGERVAWYPGLPSPSGRGAGGEGLLATAAGKKLRLWSADGEMIREYPDHPSTIADIQWHPGEPILASTAYGKLFFWDGSPSPPAPLPGGEGRMCPASLPGGEGRIAPLREFSWQGSMLALAWSPNGEYIAAGAQDCTVHFWRMKTGEDLQMAGYPTKVRELAWDPTSRYLATGGSPTCCVWDCTGKGPSGTQPIQLEAHKDHITCLAYQHQGDFLASGGADGQVVLWRPSKGPAALTLFQHDAPISQLLWSTDDRQLAVGTAAGTVVLYSIA